MSGRSSTSTKAVNRGYWDPSETMRTLAEEIVANDPTKLPAGETAVTQENYFRIASLDRLGVEQPYQFQEEGQTGYVWGSYYTDVDGVKTLGGTVNGNGYAEMPREYNQSRATFSTYFNWYAATAESAKYNVNSGKFPDSICPFGWELPVYDSGNDSSGNRRKSWINLFSEYGFGSSTNTSAESSQAARHYPINSGAVHTYNYTTGIISSNTQSSYWTAGGYLGPRTLSLDYGSSLTQNLNNAAMGSYIRCVLK